MNVNEALDEKGLFAAAQTVDPSSIIGFTWQECLERAEAAIRAYLAATTGKAAGEAVTASPRDGQTRETPRTLGVPRTQRNDDRT